MPSSLGGGAAGVRCAALLSLLVVVSGGIGLPGEGPVPRLANNRPAHIVLKSPITYIADCKDENGKARLATLFPGQTVKLVGVESDYEAARMSGGIGLPGEGPVPRLANNRPAHIALKSPITYITDCKDENGKGRLKARLATLFPGHSVELVGVESDYEAAINLVDIVDAYEGRPGIILANVARREGDHRRNKWPNGPPFSWLKLSENIDLFTTIDGCILSLLQRITGRHFALDLFDIPSTVPHMGLSPERQEHIIHTQFRSFDFLPLLAAQLCEGRELPVSGVFDEIPEFHTAICWIDSFGNIKTNCLAEDADFAVGKSVTVKLDAQRQLTLECFSRLKDVPDGRVGITIGSSGLGRHRLLEIVQLGHSAAATLALKSGTRIEFVK